MRPKRRRGAKWKNVTGSSSRKKQPGSWRLGPDDGLHITIVRENLNCHYQGEYDIRLTTTFRESRHSRGPNEPRTGTGGTHSIAVVNGFQSAKRIAERIYAAAVNVQAPDHQGESHDWI